MWKILLEPDYALVGISTPGLSIGSGTPNHETYFWLICTYQLLSKFPICSVEMTVFLCLVWSEVNAIRIDTNESSVFIQFSQFWQLFWNLIFIEVLKGVDCAWHMLTWHTSYCDVREWLASMSCCAVLDVAPKIVDCVIDNFSVD